MESSPTPLAAQAFSHKEVERDGRNLVLKKPVEIIHSIPSDSLTLVQRKLANAWLKHALETPPDDGGWWTISVSKLAANIEFDSNNHAFLIDSAKALMKIVFEWDVIATIVKTKSKWKASVLFPEVEIDPGIIRYQISKGMFERLFEPEIYALINLSIINKFRSSSSLALYEHCIRFWRVGKTTDIKWELLRGILLGERSGVKTYQEYKFFKAYVLKKAVEDVNSLSDIRIGIIETKLGRRINTITFTVAKIQVSESQVEIDPKVFQDLLEIGFNEQTAVQLCKDHSDVIAATVRFVRARMLAGDVKSPPGLLRDALQHGYGVAPEGAQVDSPPASKTGETADLFQAAQAHHAERAAQERDELQQAELYLKGLNPEQMAALETEFAASCIDSPVGGYYKKKGLENKLVRAALLKFVLRTRLQS